MRVKTISRVISFLFVPFTNDGLLIISVPSPDTMAIEGILSLIFVPLSVNVSKFDYFLLNYNGVFEFNFVKFINFRRYMLVNRAIYFSKNDDLKLND
mgnify:CR=1 FL=1